MTYAATETSRYGGAPLELYRFLIGGFAAIPAAAPSTDSLFEDDFTGYADTAAMLAVWGFTVGQFPLATCVLNPTGGEDGGPCMEITVPSGSQLGHTGGYATHAVGSLDPATRYTLAARMHVGGPGFRSENDRGLYHIGAGQSGGSWDTPDFTLDTWQTLINIDIPRWSSATEWRIQLGWFLLAYFTIYHDAIFRFDNIVLSGPGEAVPGVPAVDPTVVGYTSADVDVVFDSETYIRAQIVRSAFRTGTTETRGSEVEISLPRTHALVTLLAGPPRPPVTVEIFRLHRNDLSVGASIKPWVGKAVGLRFEGPTAIVTFANERALQDRKIPRYLTAIPCQHDLYGPLCQTSRVLNTVGPFTVSDIDGRTVTVDGAGTAAAGRLTGFPGGILKTPDSTLGLIEGAAGDVLTLKQALPTLEIGNEVMLTFGCDKRHQTCQHDFGNIEHYGGEVVMPLQSPGASAGLIGTDGGVG